MTLDRILARTRQVISRHRPRGRPDLNVRRKLVTSLAQFQTKHPYWTAPDLSGARWVSLDRASQISGISLRPAGGGRDNWLVVCSGLRGSKFRIELDRGVSGNVVVVASGSAYQGGLHIQGSECLVSLGGATDWPCMLDVRLSTSSETFLWGKGATSNGLRVVIEGDSIAAVVGDDCMFARETHLSTSDLHGIGDLETGNWINPPRETVLENHVWVGQGAMIMKGAHVGAGSIVGARALVTGRIDPQCIAAGTPAKFRRSGVAWVRDRKFSSTGSIL